MRKPRKIDFEKEQYWRTVLHHFQNSGLPFKKFCQQEKLSPNTFQYWRKVLRDRDADRGITSTIRKGDNRPSKTDEKTAYWLGVIDDANCFAGSLNEFCRQRSISSGSLYHWEARLQKAGLTAGLWKDPEQAALVPVRVVEDQVAVPAPPRSLPGLDEQKIEIRLHDGNRVFLPASLPSDFVLHMINGLRGRRP